MKGAIWEFWVYSSVVIFLAFVLWMTLTPFFNTLYTTVYNVGNFTTSSVNVSFHTAATYDKNMWNLWPIVMAAVIFIFVYVIAHDEDDYRIGGGT